MVLPMVSVGAEFAGIEKLDFRKEIISAWFGWGASDWESRRLKSVD